MTSAVLAAAKKTVLLGSVPDELCQRILDGAAKRSFLAGETIFLQGEPAQALFVIIDGLVKLYRVAQSGSEAVVSILSRNQSFAEAVALRDTVYPVSAAAITDTTLIQIDGAKLRQQIHDDPELGMNLLAASYVHLQHLIVQIEQLKARSGVQRLAEFLVELAACEGPECRVQLPYNKALIAANLGMQPESLSRAFARLRNHGVHLEASEALISDLDALRKVANQEKGSSWTR